jgi:hypothetical protein
MDDLLEPPADFSDKLSVIHFPRGSWYRVHQTKYDALFFDRNPSYRFNAPAGQFGVLYMSEAPEGAFAEALLGSRKRPLIVSEAQLQARALTVFTWRSLVLADFSGYGLAALGLDGRIANGEDYDLCRRWAAWVERHPSKVDGICYLARNAQPTRSVALFERAGTPVNVDLLEKSFMPKPGTLGPWGRKLVTTFDVGIVSS